MKNWIMELCPEIAEWQAEAIEAYHKSAVKLAREAALAEKEEPVYMDVPGYEGVRIHQGNVPAPEAKQEPVAVAVFDEQLGRPCLVEGSPMLRHGQPLYTHPAPVAEQEPLYLLHTGAIDSDGEQDEFDAEPDSYKRVEAYCRANPGITVGLYPHPAPVAKQEPDRCKHGVWAADHCYQCEKEAKQEPVGRLRMGANQDFYTTKAAGYISDNEWHDLYLHPAPVNQQLLEKAKAVVDRWETPLWKDEPATAVVINELRAAIAAAEREKT